MILGAPEAAGRLRRALETFPRAQSMLLTAHRKLKDLPPDEVDRFWRSSGARLETHINTAAAEVLVAFKGFSAAGLVASADDRHLVREAQRQLAQGNG